MNYWLSVVAPELSEGTHYSVMMYGGRLLNSCSADIPGDDDDLIALFRVNTHFCVLMDSDREKKRAQLNSTKLRIKKECEASGNISWVTDGRTIENYVPAEAADLKTLPSSSAASGATAIPTVSGVSMVPAKETPV